MLAFPASGFPLSLHSLAVPFGRWAMHRQRRAEHDALERVLAKTDERLLRDIGLDRAEGHRLLDETLVVPHHAWHGWQL